MPTFRICVLQHIRTYERIRQWPVTDIGGWPLVNESSRNKIKRIVSKICIAAPILYFSTRGNAVQILKAIRFFILRQFICERSATSIRDWSLGVLFHIYNTGHTRHKEVYRTSTILQTPGITTTVVRKNVRKGMRGNKTVMIKVTIGGVYNR